MKIFINISSNKWTQKAKPETFSFCIYPVLTISKNIRKIKKNQRLFHHTYKSRNIKCLINNLNN